MTTAVIYMGIADRREVTKEDLTKAGAKSFANSFKDLVFLRGVPQEVNDEYAEVLQDSNFFGPNFDIVENTDEVPEVKEQATDKSITKAGGSPGGTGSGTGTASAGTSSSTGTGGSTAASTGR